MSTLKSGTSASPTARIVSSRPEYVPVDASVPEMPLKTPRSAWSNEKRPSTGVCPGSSRCQGPNVPAVTISPGGTALVSVVSKGISVSTATLRTRSRCITQVRWSLDRSRGMMTSFASSATRSSTITGGPLKRCAPVVSTGGAVSSRPSPGGIWISSPSRRTCSTCRRHALIRLVCMVNDLMVMSGGTSVLPLWRMVRPVPVACRVGNACNVRPPSSTSASSRSANDSVTRSLRIFEENGMRATTLIARIVTTAAIPEPMSQRCRFGVTQPHQHNPCRPSRERPAF